MIIEKSADFGKTWRVYAYFASSCTTQFPYVPTIPTPDQPYCEGRYSDDTPSTGGEVSFNFVTVFFFHKIKIVFLGCLSCTFTKYYW
jgi:hypothetical protein